MKRIISIIILLLSFFLITSCTKELKATKFMNDCYEISSGKIKGIVVDLRCLTGDASYEEYHISGSLSYDLTKHEAKDIYDWLSGLVSTKYKVYIIDSGNNEYKEVLKFLKKFKSIYVYTEGYEKLRMNEEYNKLIIEATGTKDCGC